MSTAHIKALDLFAGTGWGVACQRLGIKEAGVEIMPEAVATREANGMETIYRDVWDGLQLTEEQHREQYGPYGLLIASPPCQTFSLAGKGAGRAALDEVLEAIELHAYKDADALLSFGEKHDMRTALVLTPLAFVWRDMPRLVALEQVPAVLPVWEACAEVMREWGYEVKVEVLNAEQYGVPQTRKRAILVARRGGPVDLPTPTHSRYYSRTPDKLDPGVKKWVSMAEALGWGFQQRPAVTAGNAVGRGLVGGSGAKDAVVKEIEAGLFKASPHGNGSNYAELTRITAEEAGTLQSYAPFSGRGLMNRPSPTITGGGTDTGGAEPIAKYHERYTRSPGWVGATDRLSSDEAAALQTYPVALKNMGRGMVERHGERPGRNARQPAFTLRASAGGTEPGGFVLQNPNGEIRKLEAAEAAALQTYPTTLRPEIEGLKWRDMPATTIAGDPRITAREHHFHGEQSKTSLRLMKDEAVILQTYESPFVWCGTKTKQFLQIGNAVPPLLAEHILAALIGIPTTQGEVR